MWENEAFQKHLALVTGPPSTGTHWETPWPAALIAEKPARPYQRGLSITWSRTMNVQMPLSICSITPQSPVHLLRGKPPCVLLYARHQGRGTRQGKKDNKKVNRLQPLCPDSTFKDYTITILACTQGPLGPGRCPPLQARDCQSRETQSGLYCMPRWATHCHKTHLRLSHCGLSLFNLQYAWPNSTVKSLS